MKNYLIILSIGLAVVAALFFGFSNKPPKVTAFDEKRTILLDSLDIEGEPSIRSLMESEKDMQETQRLDSLSHLWYHAGFPEIAADYDRQLADLNPSIPAYLRAGQTFFEALPHDTTQTMQVNLVYGARYCYEKALSIDSNNIDARIGLAKIFVQGTNEPMKGIMMLRELDAENPGNMEVNMELGRFSMMSGQYDKAIERFNSVLQKDSLFLQARFLLAESYMAIGQTDLAVKALETTIGLTGDPALDAQVRQYIETITH